MTARAAAAAAAHAHAAIAIISGSRRRCCSCFKLREPLGQEEAHAAGERGYYGPAAAAGLS